MINAFKCIKTGCDIKCGKEVYHGDLFYHHGIMVLNSSGSYYEDGFYHFEIENMTEIQASNSIFTLNGKISGVLPAFLQQMEEYESEELQGIFRDCKTIVLVGFLV
ncbi:hypothetical protein EOM81_12900 [bacterium]|nr:hypothetical protein [bacterium]